MAQPQPQPQPQRQPQPDKATDSRRDIGLVDGTRRDRFLIALGERTRALRARRGLTRKGLAKMAGVSERHLAKVEMGVGNASIQFLRQLAQALNCTLAELVGDETASSPEWLMIREILRGRSDPELAQARGSLAAMFGAPAGQPGGAPPAGRPGGPARGRQKHAGAHAGRQLGAALRRAEPADRKRGGLQPVRDPFAVWPGCLPPP